MKKTKRILAVLAAASVAASLAGCKKADNTKETTTTNQSNNTKKTGGEIVVGIQQDVTLDPHKGTTAGTEEVQFNFYEGLVKPTPTGDLAPAVASEYQISEDGKEYTFTLRPGVKFHDGTDVTVKDVAYSINRCAGKVESETGAPLMAAFSVVSEVVIDDDSHVTIKLTDSDTEFLAYLVAAIIPEGKGEEMSVNPIGTGPFKFVSHTSQDSLVLERFDQYYGTPAYLDKVTFKIISDADSSVIMALQSGAIDVYPYLSGDQAKQLEGKGFNIAKGSANVVQALFLNNNEKPFDDIRVRQALNYLVDKKEILNMVSDGNGYVIGSNFFPSFDKYYDNSLENYYKVDVDKAKALLKEAGYENGFDMTITVPSNYQLHVDTAQVIIDQLAKAGINAKLDLVEWSTWVSDTYKGRKFQSTVIGLDAELAPKSLLARYQSTGGKNFINFNNSEYDTVLAEAMNSTSDEVKIKDYKRLQQILAEQAASVFIADPASLVAVSDKLGGYTFYPVYVQDMSKLYLK